MARKKILIVDDSATALLMTRMVLAVEDIDLIEAHSGDEAVTLAHAQRPDLVVMDVVMPRMTGLEATRALRGDPETCDLPIILVTTRGEEESVEAGYAAGCTDYVTKPIDGIELLAKIRNILGDAT